MLFLPMSYGVFTGFLEKLRAGFLDEELLKRESGGSWAEDAVPTYFLFPMDLDAVPSASGRGDRRDQRV